MKYLFSFFILLFSFTGFAQELATKENMPVQRVKYYQDFISFASDKPGMSRLDIFIQVAYNEVFFVKTGQDFVSNYMITVTIFDDRKEKIISEKSWREKIQVKEFSQTNSKNNFNMSMRSFDLQPARYLVRTSIEDNESKKAYTSENIFTVRDLTERPVTSDMMFIAKQTVVEGSNKILPNISRNISAQKEGIPLFFEIYSDIPRTVNLEFVISEGEKKIISTDTFTKNVDSGKTQVFYTIEPKSLSLGNFLLGLRIMDGSKVVSSTVKSFVSRWVGVPSSITDMEKAVSQLTYIATSSEKNFIEEAPTKEEQINRYLAFWKEKDPVKTTDENEVFDEYYRRINYANENFTHYVEGWKTDRGMVFILLGAPSNIDRHPFDYDSKPYEIWEYYELNKSFVFIDETGFGDYRLTTPLYGDLYRYRY